MKLFFTAAAVLAIAACQSAPKFEGDPFGQPLTLSKITPVSEILATPAEYVGKRVLIEGEVVAVCEKKGCWMDLESGSEQIQVKVTDGEIIFPFSSRGRTALVEGTVEELKQSGEEVHAAAAHRAEEQGEAFDSTKAFAPQTKYRIQGIGALIRD